MNRLKLQEVKESIQNQTFQPIQLYKKRAQRFDYQQTVKTISVDFKRLLQDKEKFIEQLYQCLLERPCDEAGSSHYQKLLKTNAWTHRDVLMDLHHSREAQKIGVQIKGAGLTKLLWPVRKAYLKLHQIFSSPDGVKP